MSLNWASKDCGAKVIDFSSEVEGCEACNVIDPLLSNIWLTDEKPTQWLCLSLNGNYEGQKTTIRALGWHCWHPYSTNPKIVRINIVAVTSHISNSDHYFHLVVGRSAIVRGIRKVH